MWLPEEPKRVNCTAQEMKFSVKVVFSKCEQIRSLFTFTKEIIHGKLNFICSVDIKFGMGFHSECFQRVSRAYDRICGVNN